MGARTGIGSGEEWLARVGLSDSKNATPISSPAECAKRVALAQMFILNPQILLMDDLFRRSTSRPPADGKRAARAVVRRQASPWCSLLMTSRKRSRSRTGWCALGRSGLAPICDTRSTCPRPRDVAEIRLAPRFIEIHAKIWHSMKEEVPKRLCPAAKKIEARKAACVCAPSRCWCSRCLSCSWHRLDEPDPLPPIISPKPPGGVLFRRTDPGVRSPVAVVRLWGNLRTPLVTLVRNAARFFIGTVSGMRSTGLALSPTASAILDPYIKAVNAMPR